MVDDNLFIQSDSKITAANRTFASFGTRYIAFSIDCTLLTGLYLCLFLLVGIEFFPSFPVDFFMIARGFSLYFFSFLFLFFFFSMAYFMILHAATGQTIGKMIMGIKVVSKTKGLLTLGEAFLRWAGYCLSGFPLAAGFLWSAVDKTHAAWHDKLAGSQVIILEK